MDVPVGRLCIHTSSDLFSDIFGIVRLWALIWMVLRDPCRNASLDQLITSLISLTVVMAVTAVNVVEV